MFDPIMYALCKGSGSGLPVVELTTAPTAEGATLTESERTALLEVLATGQMFAVKFHAGNFSIVSVASVMQNDPVNFISLWHSSGTFDIVNESDVNSYQFFYN